MMAGTPGPARCDWPWRGAYLSWQGEAMPCCMVSTPDRLSLGSAAPGGLAAVWDGEHVTFFVDGRRSTGRETSSPGGLKTGGGGLIIGGNTVLANDPVKSFAFAGVIEAVHLSRVARYTEDYEPPTEYVADADTGKVVIEAIAQAVTATLTGACRGVVTSPIHKAALYAAGFKFPGHTEYLASLCAAGGTTPMPGDEATAALLDAIPGTVFTAGDNVYNDGTTAQFASCYHPTWGRHKDRTRPAPGNHDYNTSNASGYYDYFGAAAGPAGRGYYSYDLGDWHIIALNSNCDAVGGCQAGSPQEQWLRADLAFIGYGELAPQVWVSPYERAELDEVLERASSDLARALMLDRCIAVSMDGEPPLAAAGAVDRGRPPSWGRELAPLLEGRIGPAGLDEIALPVAMRERLESTGVRWLLGIGAPPRAMHQLTSDTAGELKQCVEGCIPRFYFAEPEECPRH